VLIAAKNSLRPLVIYPQQNCVEQMFVKLLLPNQSTILIANVYLPPTANAEVYEVHAREIDNIYQSCKYDIGIVCGNFNLPSVTWIRNNETTTFSVTINEKVRIIGHQYAFLNFIQNNMVRNNNGAILDLVFSNCILNIETAPDDIVPSDIHHPPLLINCPLQKYMIMLRNYHTYRDFKQTNFKAIESNLNKIDWKTTFIDMSTKQAADYLPVLISLIDQFIPTRVFRKSNYPQ